MQCPYKQLLTFTRYYRHKISTKRLNESFVANLTRPNIVHGHLHIGQLGCHFLTRYQYEGKYLGANWPSKPKDKIDSYVLCSSAINIIWRNQNI